MRADGIGDGAFGIVAILVGAPLEHPAEVRLVARVGHHVGRVVDPAAEREMIRRFVTDGQPAPLPLSTR